MPTIQSPLLGGFAQDRALIQNAQRCVNLYVEISATKDGKEPGALYGTPGLVRVLEVELGPWRCLHPMGSGALFGVVNNTFVQITGAYNIITLGHITSFNGPVSCVDSGRQMLLIDGFSAFGYDMDTGRFEAINFPFNTTQPIVGAYQDGFFLVNQTGTQSWWQSNNGDVFTWDALNFSQKDGQPDPIVTMVDNHREVWLFGSQTTEVWINAGNPGFSFQRLQGVFLQVGCAAPFSAVVVGQSVIWLGRDKEGFGIVYQSNGYQAQRISTHAIEREIQSYGNLSDALAFVYQQEGHVFWMCTFPQVSKTWCYDNNTGLWHERADWRDGHFYRHRMNCVAPFKGKILVGDFENGKLYELRLDAYDDDGRIKKSLRTWPAQPTGQLNLTNQRHVRLQIYTIPGGRSNCGPPIRVLQSSDDDWRVLSDSDDNVRVLSGIPDPNCSDPQYMLRWSDTGGQSWSNEHWQSALKEGEYEGRVIWRRLGSSRDRIYELSVSDPIPVAWVGAFLEVLPAFS